MLAACGGSSPGAGSGGSSPGAGGAPAAAGPSLALSGGHLADSAGRTVYLWDGDHGATSACSGACASVWPPVTASGNPSVGDGLTAADLTTVRRADGRTQLVYAGHPLYYYAGDSGPGQTHGQGNRGFGAAWWEVDGSGGPVTATGGGGASTPSPVASSAAGGYDY